MNIRTFAAFACTAFLLLTGCSVSGLVGVKPDVDVEIYNLTSRNLMNAEVRFEKYACQWGTVAAHTSASYLFFPHLITSKSELHWDLNGEHFVETLDLTKVYRPRSSGRLIFTIHDEKADVSFKEKR